MLTAGSRLGVGGNSMKWEYQVLNIEPRGSGIIGTSIPEKSLAQELNKLGQQGWEVTGTFTSAMYNGTTCSYCLILKRLVV